MSILDEVFSEEKQENSFTCFTDSTFSDVEKTCWVISSCWFSVGWEETSSWNCTGYANISSERHKIGDSTWLYNWFDTDLCAERFRRWFEVIGWWIEGFECCCCWRRVPFEFAIARKGVELRRRYRLGRCKDRRWRTEEGILGILTSDLLTVYKQCQMD